MTDKKRIWRPAVPLNLSKDEQYNERARRWKEDNIGKVAAYIPGLADDFMSLLSDADAALKAINRAYTLQRLEFDKSYYSRRYLFYDVSELSPEEVEERRQQFVNADEALKAHQRSDKALEAEGMPPYAATEKLPELIERFAGIKALVADTANAEVELRQGWRAKKPIR